MKEMTCEATLDNIESVTNFVNAELKVLSCPLGVQAQIDLVVDEMFANIANYAYNPSVGYATVRVEPCENPRAVVITFIDCGKPYDPLTTKEPDVTLSAEEREVGGLGIFLVKHTMDSLSYEYKDGNNIFRITKAF